MNQQRPAYGGQAVIEGVMIRGKDHVVTACRKKDGDIVVRRDEVDGLTKRYPWLRTAFVRGTPALIDSLRLGYRTLMWSADVAMEGEGEQKPSNFQYFLSIFFAMVIGIGVFVILPTYALQWLFHKQEVTASNLGLLQQLIPSAPALLINVVEGLFRVLLLVAYILFVGRNKEIRRVFAYHGAEHKVVNAWEDGAELTLDGVRKYSRIHPRCGTSFLFLVFIVGILVHALIGWPEAWVRVVSRLLMFPIIAGIAYELIRLSGRFRESRLLRVLIWPGLLLQRLTTAEPADDQVEVALYSMRTVLADEGAYDVEPETPVVAADIEAPVSA